MDVKLSDELPGIGGVVEVQVIRDTPYGPRVIRQVVSNLVVNIGKKRTFRFATGTITTHTWDQMRLGKNSAAAGSADTNVKTAITATRNTVDSSTIDAGRTWKWINSYPSGGGSLSAAAIKEVVLLDTNTTPGGSAFMRAVFATVAKTTADKLKITYKCRIT